MKWFKKNKEIESSFFNWVFCTNAGWKWKYIKQIGHNPILSIFVNLCIYFDWFNKDGTFEKGDKVKYNFFARIVIPTIYEVKSGEILTFKGYPDWSKSKANVIYDLSTGEEGSCAAFWLTKIH